MPILSLSLLMCLCLRHMDHEGVNGRIVMSCTILLDVKTHDIPTFLLEQITAL